MPYEALLVDLDGVVRHWNASDESIELAHGLPSGSIRRAAFRHEYLLPAITGAISDESWRKQIGERLVREFGVASAHEAVLQWSSSPGTVDRKVLSLLEACTSSLRLVLVTNATSRLPHDLRSLGLSERFFEVVNSSDLGVAKPDPEVFRIALRRVGTTPEQALLVDDTSANVATAAALGIRSHHFVGTTQLAAFLEAEGVLREEAL